MTDLAALESRLRRLEDLAEINQLFIDYGVHLDAGDFESYASLFATDGEVKLGPMGRAKGPAEIRALMERVLTGLVGTTYHVISSPVVELDGDRATSRVMWTVVERTADGHPRVSMVGRHLDELIRENDRWKFKSRRGQIDIPSAYSR
jgi:ketosteroid isomerase-like protein